MSADLLVKRLHRLGVRLRADAGELVVDAPRGVLTDELKAELVARKSEVLPLVRALRLADFAADRLPIVRFTIRETGDARRDFDLVGRARSLISEFQPGGNHVYLNVVTLDGRRVLLEWRALVSRELRLSLARILADAALEREAVTRRVGVEAKDSPVLQACAAMHPQSGLEPWGSQTP